MQVRVSLWGTDPQQQGSKNPWGGDANKNLKPWREALAAEAADVMAREGLQPVNGPVKVTAVFVYARPNSHFRTGNFANVLKENAPFFKESAPDTDKLERAVGDALSKVVIRDDARIAWWDAKKIYVNDVHPRVGVTVLVSTL